MIIKGNARSAVGWWGKHLTNDVTNDRAEVMEIKGLLSDDVPTALREMSAIAGQSRCGGNFMYAASINPRDNEVLTPEQWTEAVDTLEKNLRLEGHQRVVVEHEKEGRAHRHVIWNRVDGESLRVTDIGGNYYTHERTARDLEERFSLGRTQGRHGGDRLPELPAERTPELWEIRAAERSGIKPDDIKAELTELWRTTDSGKAFAAGIADQGLVLARGDRRDFVVIDAAGTVHSLAKRIEGVKVKDLRERFADLDPAELPSVTEAKAQQHERFPTGIERAADTGRLLAGNQPENAAQPHEAEGREIATAGVADVLKGGSKAALMVVDGAAGVAMKLTDYVASLIVGSVAGTAPPRPTSQPQQIMAQRRALTAIHNMADRMERGVTLQAADVRNLTQDHLLQINSKGDDYVRGLVSGLTRERDERERDRWGWER